MVLRKFAYLYLVDIYLQHGFVLCGTKSIVINNTVFLKCNYFVFLYFINVSVEIIVIVCSAFTLSRREIHRIFADVHSLFWMTQF